MSQIRASKCRFNGPVSINNVKHSDFSGSQMSSTLAVTQSGTISVSSGSIGGAATLLEVGLGSFEKTSISNLSAEDCGTIVSNSAANSITGSSIAHLLTSYASSISVSDSNIIDQGSSSITAVNSIVRALSSGTVSATNSNVLALNSAVSSVNSLLNLQGGSGTGAGLGISNGGSVTGMTNYLVRSSDNKLKLFSTDDMTIMTNKNLLTESLKDTLINSAANYTLTVSSNTKELTGGDHTIVAANAYIN
jgi:hypothetical protein